MPAALHKLGVWQSFRYAARLNCKLVGIILVFSICARLLCVCGL